MTKILGFSGKKQAGKNVNTNFIFGNIMYSLKMIQGFKLNEKGQLVAEMMTDDGTKEGIVDPLDTDPQSQMLYAQYVWPFVKVYSFADPLKEFIINVLGLEHRQCYGTDEDKNSLTHLRWEDMPAVYCGPDRPKFNAVQFQWLQNHIDFRENGGYMTGREVLQYFGTDVCRKMYGNVWVDATIRKIKQENPAMALLSDVRFPNEVEGIQAAGGKVVRLLRAPFEDQDQHASETALDNYSADKFDAVMDNREWSIEQQCQELFNQLKIWGWDSIDTGDE